MSFSFCMINCGHLGNAHTHKGVKLKQLLSMLMGNNSWTYIWNSLACPWGWWSIFYWKMLCGTHRNSLDSALFTIQPMKFGVYPLLIFFSKSRFCLLFGARGQLTIHFSHTRLGIQEWFVRPKVHVPWLIRFRGLIAQYISQLNCTPLACVYKIRGIQNIPIIICKMSFIRDCVDLKLRHFGICWKQCCAHETWQTWIIYAELIKYIYIYRISSLFLK